MKVLIAGDFVPFNRTAVQIESGDFSCIESVKPLTSQCDYSIVNFESPVVEGEAHPIAKTGPNLKCHKNAMEAVKQAGFNCVTLANNHFYDYGEKGVHDTIANCKKMDIDYVGGGVNLEEAERIIYKEIDGKTLAVVNFCENEWSIATKTTGGSAPYNLIHNIRNIQKAKKEANYVLTIVHGGSEGYALPTPRMKDAYRFFIEQGADAVVNHHQHCYSGMENYLGKPIVYGLGNFCFDMKNLIGKKWNLGYVAIIDFSENNTGIQLFPFTQCDEKPCVKFIKEKQEFSEDLQQLNETIQDDNALQESFEKMSHTKRHILKNLDPYRRWNFYRILQDKGWVPLTLANRNLILNLFRCETHRDVMFNLLQNSK